MCFAGWKISKRSDQDAVIFLASDEYRSIGGLVEENYESKTRILSLTLKINQSTISRMIASNKFIHKKILELVKND